MSSMNVISSPQGCGLLTINLSSKTLCIVREGRRSGEFSMKRYTLHRSGHLLSSPCGGITNNKSHYLRTLFPHAHVAYVRAHMRPGNQTKQLANF